ncbi:unannotated protein [freshwater metagenome]|uniref:Unannotated protein n=1 Tax=freshwater metagenome TaxID=449393 RepID=A0A6J7KXA6_9ZZZZ|nr:hypothetical protein [Actinomycetota bacterium]
MRGYRFLAQPRWLALGFLVLLVVPSFFLLSRWQLTRLGDREHSNDVIRTNGGAASVAVDELMTPGAASDSVTDAQRWRMVSAEGHFDVAGERIVRKRPYQGANGFWVATPFVTSAGVVLVVDRGWIAATGGATSAQVIPAPPSGTVTLTGRIQPSEAAPTIQPTDLPTGQITDLNVELVAGTATHYPGFVTLVASEPAQDSGLTIRSLPALDNGPHLSYAMQWIIFAAIAVAGFVLLVRRERVYGDTTARTDVGPAPAHDVLEGP